MPPIPVTAPSGPAADAILAEIIAAHRHMDGALLPMLHAVQEALGHVPESAVVPIAEALNLGRAEVHGVISFYHDFRAAPAGRRVVKICRAEACQAMGGAELAEGALARAGLDWHGTRADGSVTVEPVYCLGLCACAPAVMVDDRVHGRVTAARLDALIAGGRA